MAAPPKAFIFIEKIRLGCLFESFVFCSEKIRLGCSTEGSSFAHRDGVADRVTSPPRLAGARRCPPKRGALRWLLERWCFAPGRSEICGEFHEGTHANRDAQILAKKPTKLGGQRRRRGGHVLAFCNTNTMSKTPTSHPTPSLPPS